MNIVGFRGPARAGAAFVIITMGFVQPPPRTVGADFATRVVAYQPGVGFATEFGTGAGYTNPLAALGEPSRLTPGPFGGPVDPFSPPFTREQLVSIGAGGSLTLAFGAPIVNRSENPFGIDFIVFGSAGFVITNGDFTGGGVTDGSLFGANRGGTRVSVSTDSVAWFALDPARAPGADGLFPTDGAGDFTRPVDPALTSANFGEQGLAGIRQRYAGAGGGAGFDLNWAVDAGGRPVDLPGANFVRIETLGGSAEIDAVSIVSPTAIVPEPGTWALVLAGALVAVAQRWHQGGSRTCATESQEHS